MTLKRSLIYAFLQWAVLVLVKVFYFNNYLPQGQLGFYLYLILIAVAVAAIVRRLHVLSFLEAAVLSLAWLVTSLFLDYIVTNQFLPAPVFSHAQVWVAYGIMVFTIFFWAWVGNVGLVLAFTGVLALLMLADSVVGGQLAATNLSFQTQIWAGYVIMILSVAFFHKKRHIHIREEMHAKH